MKKYTTTILIIALSSLALVPMLPKAVHASSCSTSYASNKIEGCVVNYDNGSPVANLLVVIISCGGFQITNYVYTDTSGHFSFQGTSGTICIFGGNSYSIAVNGVTPVTSGDGCYPLPSPCAVVGVAAYDQTWGQWAGDANTDGNGYGSLTIQLTPGRIVNVPAAALYSNTMFGTLDYEMQSSYSISHTIGASVSIDGGASVSGSYSSTVKMTYTQAFTVPPNNAQYVEQPWYVIGYYCAGSTSESFYGWTCSQGLQNAGLSEAQPNTTWGALPTSEYISDPGSVQGYCDTSEPQGTHSISYTQSSGFSATLKLGSSVSIEGVSVGLSYSVTVTSGTSDTIKLTVNNPTTLTRTFRLYYAGGTCSNPTSELHVWEYPTAPADFSISASPSSLGIAQSSSGSSTPVTTYVQATNGFASNVALTASSTDPNFQLTLSPTTVNPNGGTTSTALTVNDPKGSDCGSYSITVTGQGSVTGQSPLITRSVTIPVTVIPVGDFCISANPLAIDVTGSPSSSGSQMITISVTSGISSSATLSANAQGGLQPWFNPSTLTITSGGTATASVSFSPTSSSTQGTYSATITATASGITHSTTVSIFYSGDYGLGVMSYSIYASPGSTTASTITVTPTFGFSGYVYPYTNTPSGIYATFAANPILAMASYGPSSTSMTIHVPSTTPVGSYGLIINSYYSGPHGGMLWHSIGITVYVSSGSCGCGGGGGGGGGGPPKPMSPSPSTNLALASNKRD